MKKIITFSLLTILCASFVQAQEDEMASLERNEIKINASNLIAFTFLDVSYETLLNEESSFGIGILFNVGNDNSLEEYRTFSLTPYYRQYFSKKYAEGFFVEGFGMLNSGKEEYDDYDYIIGSNIVTEDTYTDFALGISAGGKFVTKRGFVAEIYAGIGRNLIGGDNFPDIVGRGGISLGYRF